MKCIKKFYFVFSKKNIWISRVGLCGTFSEDWKRVNIRRINTRSVNKREHSENVASNRFVPHVIEFFPKLWWTWISRWIFENDSTQGREYLMVFRPWVTVKMVFQIEIMRKSAKKWKKLFYKNDDWFCKSIKLYRLGNTFVMFNMACIIRSKMKFIISHHKHTIMA